MFDDESFVTSIEKSNAHQLGLEGQRILLTLQWYDNRRSFEMRQAENKENLGRLTYGKFRV